MKLYDHYRQKVKKELNYPSIKLVSDGDLINYLKKTEVKEPEVKETEFHLLAVDEGVIKKPIIKAQTEADARATFLTECPNATIHECRKLD